MVGTVVLERPGSKDCGSFCEEIRVTGADFEGNLSESPAQALFRSAQRPVGSVSSHLFFVVLFHENQSLLYEVLEKCRHIVLGLGWSDRREKHPEVFGYGLRCLGRFEKRPEPRTGRVQNSGLAQTGMKKDQTVLNFQCRDRRRTTKALNSTSVHIQDVGCYTVGSESGAGCVRPGCLRDPI